MRGWIPPLPLACGTLAFGLSWIALFAVARDGAVPALAVFGWLHLVTLGWITLIALSILLHVIPAFLDVEWRTAGIARISTLAFAAGVAVLLAGFFLPQLDLIAAGGTIVTAAIVVYAAAALQPLRAALRGERTERAIARALAMMIGALVVTAAIGVTMAYALGGHVTARALAGAPQAHALLGIGGWLTLLVFGVSARTLGPIAGVRSRWIGLHVAAGSAVGLGTIAAAAGAFAATPALLASGCALLVIGALSYALDVGDVLLRATVTHRPPQWLMACAALWALVSAALTFGAALGRPWSAGAIYLALLGWIGSAVLAHIHHIGIRVLLTTLRGEDDETRPSEVLTAPLTWTTAILYQIAVIAGTAGGLAALPEFVELAALAGFLSFVSLIANVALAASRARR